MMHLEVALLEDLPLERAVLHPVLAERHIHAVGELGTGVGWVDPRPTTNPGQQGLDVRTFCPITPHGAYSRATPLASRPTSWNMEMVD